MKFTAAQIRRLVARAARTRAPARANPYSSKPTPHVSVKSFDEELFLVAKVPLSRADDDDETWYMAATASAPQEIAMLRGGYETRRPPLVLKFDPRGIGSIHVPVSTKAQLGVAGREALRAMSTYYLQWLAATLRLIEIVAAERAVARVIQRAARTRGTGGRVNPTRK